MIESEQARDRLEEFNAVFDKTLSMISQSTNCSNKLEEDNYYFDILRWPSKAMQNFAKHKTIQALGLPEKHNIEVTTQCVLKCDFCVLHSGALLKKRRKAFMTSAKFERLFSQMEPFITHIEFTGGEPFLNNDLFKMIDLCNQSAIKTTIATNAQLLTADKIEKVLNSPPSILLVAYEGGHENSYDAHRKGGSFQKLKRNLDNLIERKKNKGQSYPRIHLQTVVSRKTVSQVEQFWEDAKNSGVDSACIKPIFIWPDGPDEYQRLMIDEYLIPEHPLSYHTLNSNGKLNVTSIPNFCPNTKAVHIGTDGEVVPCWYNLLSSPTMGNITEKHFFEIWFSDNYIEFRKKMAAHTAYTHKCRHCIGIYKPDLFEVRSYPEIL